MLKSSVSKIGLLVNPKVLAFALPLPEKRMLLAVDAAQLYQAAVKHLKADQSSMNQFVQNVSFNVYEYALIATVLEV